MEMAVSALGGPMAPSGVNRLIDESSTEGSRVSDEIGLGLGFFVGLTAKWLEGCCGWGNLLQHKKRGGNAEVQSRSGVEGQ